MTSLDDYFNKRKGSMENAPTSTVTPPETDPAKLYISRLTDTLSGNDSTVKNARQEASTKNAVGDYLAHRQGQQESVQAGYTPGTLQTQRTIDRYQAPQNEMALARDNQVNDVARTRSDSALSGANQIRQEQNTQAETLRQEGVTQAERLREEQVAQAERLRQEELQTIETLITSVTDPVTQAYLRRVQAAGGDVRAALAGNLGTGTGTGGNGTGTGNGTGGGAGNGTGGTDVRVDPNNPNNRLGDYTDGFDDAGNAVDKTTGLPISDSPAELALKNATNEVKTFYPDLDPNSDEFKQLVQARTSGATEAQLRAIQDANKASKLTEATTAAKSNLNTLTPAQLQLLTENTTETNPLEIPNGTGLFDAFKATHPIVKIGGQLFKPLDTIQWKEGKNRDFSVFQGPGNTYLYVDKSGKITTTPIPTGSGATKQARTDWLNSFHDAAAPVLTSSQNPTVTNPYITSPSVHW